MKQTKPSTALIVAAFAAIYLIWGSTYLGIAIAIKTMPPILMGGFRFLTAGIILFFFSRLKNAEPLTFKHWKENGIPGILMVFGGNGAVVWAEQYLPSGLVAVIVASVPISLALLDRANWRNTFGRPLPIIGLLSGFAGVVILVTSGTAIKLEGGGMTMIAFFVVICGTFCWAGGTLYSRNVKSPTSVFVRVSIQMIVGGVFYLLIGAAVGELPQLNFSAMSSESIGAFIYLVTIGSLVAYLAYVWLLTVRPAAQVGTYAYVNPVVAVILGWFVMNEKPSIQMFGALILILTGVIILNVASQKKDSPAAEAEHT